MGRWRASFPKCRRRIRFYPDERREAFNRSAADPIGEGSDRQLLEMPFFDYVALTRARRLLVVSYPVADRQGKSLRRSRHIARLSEIFAEKRLQSFDANGLGAAEVVCTADDLLASFARQLREKSGQIDLHARAVSRWIAGRNDAAIVQARLQLQRALAGRPAEHLEAELAAQFFPRNVPLRLSVSRLERFASCPLQYFLQYTLGLSPRKEFQIDPMSRGQLVHRILELFYRRVITGYPQWPAVTLDEVTAILKEAVTQAVRELHAEAEAATPGYEKMTERLQRTLGVQLEADRRRAEVGEMRPHAVETVFDGGRKEADASGGVVKWPMRGLTTPGGVRLELNGKIDRIDQHRGAPAMMAVIDYKTGGRAGVKLDHVIEGLELQLPAYALVLRELLHAEPVAAFILRLAMPREKVKDGEKPPRPPEDDFYQQFKPRGMIDADHADALDRRIHPGDNKANSQIKSDWFRAEYRKDGEPTRNSDLLDHGDFEALLDFTKWKLMALADEMTRGRVVASTYRIGTETPCDYCDFRSLCDFDQTRGAFRTAARLKQDECLARMRELAGAGGR